MEAKADGTRAKKIVIVGGVAGGMSAAARARRLSEKSKIIIFERTGYVSFANCGLPYYIGGEIENHDDLILQTPESLQKRFDLDIRVNHEVTKIDNINKTVTVLERLTGNQKTESYDELILAVGAAPVKPPIPGIDMPGIFVMRNIEDVDAIESWIKAKNPKNIVVAGGGFIGLETAEQLVKKGFKVTLVEGLSQVLQPIDKEMAAIVEAELTANGIELVLNSSIKEFKAPADCGDQNNLPKAGWVLAGEREPIPADMIILGLGIRPELKLAKEAGLETGALGGIRVNKYLETSTKQIWAVGDAIEVIHPVSGEWTRIALGGPANRQGRCVADNIFGRGKSYDGTIGTTILRVFNLCAACTGLNESQIRAAKIPYESLYIHPAQHAGYFPGATRLTIKALFKKGSGEILGAQIIGKDGVDKRIDVIATAIKAGLKIQELADLELAYAPPFGSAKDPVNLLGMAAENILNDLSGQVQWHEVPELDAEKFCILDVRSSQERKSGFISGSIHIPLPVLRENCSELPPGKTVVVYCQSGQRSYYATRMLLQKGFKALNLSGGYLMWKSAQSADKQQKSSQTESSGERLISAR